MGIVTYDGLNGASAQSCKDPCLSRQRIVDQIVAGTYIYICCFTFISMLKSVNQFRQARVNLLRLVLGRNVNGNAVKMLL